MKLFLVLHLHSHFALLGNEAFFTSSLSKPAARIPFQTFGSRSQVEEPTTSVKESLRCPKGRLLGKTLTEHEDCHDCTGRDLGRLCFCRGLPSLCFSCRGCVFSMPSGFLTVHKGLFIHRRRMPAGVSTNQIMTLSAPAHWPAATTHMTPRNVLWGKKKVGSWRELKRYYDKEELEDRRAGGVIRKPINCTHPQEQKANSAQGKAYFH